LNDEVDEKHNRKQKCSSVENLIEMLENTNKDNNESISNDIEEDCSQKLIQPGDIKQEAIHPELENVDDDIDDDDDDDDEEEEDLDDSTMLDDDDSDYEGNDNIKNGGESSSKKTKVTKNAMKKKTPEILIPQMVSFKTRNILIEYFKFFVL